MNPQTTDMEAIRERVAKLERQNRRFKQAAAVVLALAASLLLMGQAPGHQTVEANEFLLKDAEGKVRGRFSVNDGNPQLELLDANGQPRVVLAEAGGTSGLSLSPPNRQGGAHLLLYCRGSAPDDCYPSLTLTAQDRKYGVELVSDDINGSLLVFTDATNFPQVVLGSRAITRGTQGVVLRLMHPYGGVELETDEDGPRVGLLDREGFKTTIGSTRLVTTTTGETHKTSAASVVLLDKDKHVLWQAP